MSNAKRTNKLKVGAKLLYLAIILAFALLPNAQVKVLAQDEDEGQEVPTPPDLVISAITTTSATVAVQATSGCDVENIILEYYQDTSDGSDPDITNIASGVCSDLIGNEYGLTGLTANTTYSVRVSATLQDSLISDDVVTTFTTDPIAQPLIFSIDVTLASLDCYQQATHRIHNSPRWYLSTHMWYRYRTDRGRGLGRLVPK